MTAEEIAVAAMAKATEFTTGFPSVRSVMFRRIGQRQMQLFALAGKENPDYFGICVSVTVPQGAADLKEMFPDFPTAEGVGRVEVHTQGASPYPAGTKINVVPYDDPDVAFAPRAVIRNGNLFQVGTDLNGVGSIRIYYTKLPAPFDHSSKNTEAELPLQFQELLVVDLAKDLIRKTMGLAPDAKAEMISILKEEEDELLELFLEHVRRYEGALTQRFDTRTSVSAR